jgi:hypothetical protein
MSAATTAPSGTFKNTWCSHKVVVLPPQSVTSVFKSSEKVNLPDYNQAQMWRILADAEAALFLRKGHRYLSNASSAPSEWVAYRDDPASGWVPTSKNGKTPKDKGHGKKYGNKARATNADGLVVSHWYVGSPK